METRFLQTFLAVVETGSMAEAARRLNITPSAVTQRIQALEIEIGHPLLHRSGQRMGATPTGVRVLAQARRMIVLADDMRAESSLDGDTGLLRVGTIQSALTGLLPSVLMELRRKKPKIDLYLAPGSSADLYRRLTSGDLDVAIMVKPPFAVPKSFEWKALRYERHLFISRPEGSGEINPKAVLRHEPFIRYDRNHWGGRAVDQYLRSHRIRPREQYELDSLEAIVIMVSRGLGASIVPDWPAPWPNDSEVRKTVLMDAPVREVGMIWSRGAKRFSLIRHLVSETVQVSKVQATSTATHP